ncbi:hypothetical protein BC833DRAFT_585770 [Globomyces pollinis-pini]|nr:hypothetical protein BC833DRAFT_585770 [Globomyces pollinis-pini]
MNNNPPFPTSNTLDTKTISSILNIPIHSDLITWLNSYSNHPNIDKSITNLIDQFLDLLNPKITKDIAAFLRLKNALEYYLHKITLPPDSFSYTLVTLDHCRYLPRLYSDIDYLIPHKATKAIIFMSNITRLLIRDIHERVTYALISFFHIHSHGSFFHLREMLPIFMNFAPNVLSNLFKLKSDLDSPLIMQFLYHIVNPPIQDCLILIFVKLHTQALDSDRKQILEVLVECDFLLTLFNFILGIVDTPHSIANNDTDVTMEMDNDITVNQETEHQTIISTAQIQDISLIAIHVFERLLAATSHDDSFVFYLPLIGQNSPLHKIFNTMVSPTTDASIRNAYLGLFVNILSQQSTASKSLVQFTSELFQSRLLELYRPSFYSFLTSVYKFKVLNSTAMVHSKIPNTISLYSQLPWDLLLKEFFGQYRNSSIYQLRIYQLIHPLIVENGSVMIDVMLNSGLIDLLIQNFNANNDAKSYVRLILVNLVDMCDNPILLEYLSHIPEWESYKVQLVASKEIQQQLVGEFPITSKTRPAPFVSPLHGETQFVENESFCQDIEVSVSLNDEEPWGVTVVVDQIDDSGNDSLGSPSKDQSLIDIGSKTSQSIDMEVTPDLKSLTLDTNQTKTEVKPITVTPNFKRRRSANNIKQMGKREDFINTIGNLTETTVENNPE